MPRKTKEQMEEQEDATKKKTTTKKTNIEKETKTTKKTTTKKNTKKTDSKKEEKPKTTKKASTKTESREEKTPKTTKKATTKKASTKTENGEEKPHKTTKKTTTKKASAKVESSKEKSSKTTKKATQKKTASTTKKETTKKSVTKKATTTRKTKSSGIPVEVEYYDLPYRYDKTVVKVLYQNPTTLFVYWEISGADIENYKKQYGDNFFEKTEPILTVYNDSMNYQFDVVINDFANSWYFNIKDAECNYHVELGRRPKYNGNIERNYIYITSSNNIESPNDRILYNTNADNSVYFKNTNNNATRKVSLKQLIEQLNINNKKFEFPLIKNLPDIYKNIFGVEEMSEFNILSNPSSGNPSSGNITIKY